MNSSMRALSRLKRGDDFQFNRKVDEYTKIDFSNYFGFVIKVEKFRRTIGKLFFLKKTTEY